MGKLLEGILYHGVAPFVASWYKRQKKERNTSVLFITHILLKVNRDSKLKRVRLLQLADIYDPHAAIFLKIVYQS